MGEDGADDEEEVKVRPWKESLRRCPGVAHSVFGRLEVSKDRIPLKRDGNHHAATLEAEAEPQIRVT